MTEGGAEDPIRAIGEPEEEEISYSPINMRQAKEYSDGLEKILDDFKDLLWEGKDDALEVTIKHMKRHMAKTWADMSAADANIVITSIHEPSCLTLHDSLETEGVRVSNPEEDILTGLEVTRGLPHQHNEKTVTEHCIILFDHLSEATSHISAAMVNLSSLAKITDHEAFKIILQASTRTLVQLNIPANMLNLVMDRLPPVAGEAHKLKI